jgi:hypothetical protein
MCALIPTFVSCSWAYQGLIAVTVARNILSVMFGLSKLTIARWKPSGVAKDVNLPKGRTAEPRETFPSVVPRYRMGW